MAKASKLVASETYERDGLKYEVRASLEGGRLWPRWTCETCGEVGSSSLPGDSAESALLNAKMNLSLHHGAHMRERGQELTRDKC